MDLCFRAVLTRVLRLIFPVWSVAGLLLVVANVSAADAKVPVAFVLSTEGTVECLLGKATAWVLAKPGQELRVGDQLRSGPNSRALIRLSNLSVLRVGELMTYEIQPPRTSSGKPVINVKAGSAYFFSRDRPQEIQLRTPVATGAIRGTEFNVTVAENGRTELTMFDGEVELAGEQGSVLLVPGDQGVAETGRAPTKTSALNAINVIQWTLYYPAVIDSEELRLDAGERQALGESLAEYRRGDLLGALKKHPGRGTPTSASGRVYLSALLLAAGSVAEAGRQLEAIPTSDAAAPLADSVRQLIAAVQFQSWTRPRPSRLASEWLAESYYAQSRSSLTDALAAARKAVEQSPAFGFGWARVAELEFGFGHTAEALTALNKGLEQAPRNAQAVALKGFLLSAQNRIDEALDQFNQAIALDGALGNAWLGRGLCRIRRGDSDAGREDLEVAAALEPNRAVLRSYLGKAFSHVGDTRRAAAELALAKKFDANDPTAWLYSALLNQQRNRINDAISDLEESQRLNDNRSVYRSRLLLDQDRAVRELNLANLYNDAGMTDVGVREAVRAANSDYASYSAHLFLANGYQRLRDPKGINLRYETPATTEFLLANLLAPVGAGTLSPIVSQQEYSRLFERDGLHLASATEYSSHGAWFTSGAQYGTFGNLSYSLDAVYRSDNGFRPNNDLEQTAVSLQFKQHLTPADGLFVQAIYNKTEGGDLTQYYDQNQANTTLRFKETQEPLLLAGYRHEWSPGNHTLLLATRLQDTYRQGNLGQPVLLLVRDPSGAVVALPYSTNTMSVALPGTALDYCNDFEAYTVELQQLWKSGNHSVIAGSRFQTGDLETRSALGPFAFSGLAFATATNTGFGTFSGSVPPEENTTDLLRLTFYGYYYWQVAEPLLLIGGVTYDRLDYPVNFRVAPTSPGEETAGKVSPKVGFIWTPLEDTTVRGAYTRALGGVSFDQSFQLEPAQIAGFTQTYRSLIPESAALAATAPRFESVGLALDQKFNTGTYLGVQAELLESHASQALGAVDLLPSFPPAYAANVTGNELDYREKSFSLTLNQLVGRDWAFGARYRISEAELDDTVTEIPTAITQVFDRHVSATLNQVQLFALFNHPCGFFSQFDTVWSQQSNHGYSPALPGDDFWHFNVSAGYRFFRRNAEVRVGILNLTDRDYQLNPLNLATDLPRQRVFTASFQFRF